jgi:hypothetical protein
MKTQINNLHLKFVLTLFTDDGHSFDRVLFYGHEFTLFTFDVSLFCCAEMLTGNFLLATIITALANKVCNTYIFF